MEQEPQTLLEAIRYFSDPDICFEYATRFHWPTGQVACPTCGSLEIRFLSTRRIWECRSKHARKQFSVKVGTIFEDSPIGFDKWLPAIWMIANDKNGVSSYEIARGLGVTQKTAWFMLHRIRRAMQAGSFDKFGGTVEVDETFIGGKARNMHKAERERKITGRGAVGKEIVMGLLERHTSGKASKVRVSHVSERDTKTLQPVVKAHVKAGAEVMTDALASYNGLEAEYIHGVIDHAEKYVEGHVEGHIHTNGIEKHERH